MTVGVTHTPEFDIPFHMVRLLIRCLFKIIEYFMNTECPWLVVQGDCNLHKCCGKLCGAVNVTRAITNKTNTITNKYFVLALFQMLMPAFIYAKPLYVLSRQGMNNVLVPFYIYIIVFIYLPAFIVHGHFSIFTSNTILKLTIKTNKLITLLVIIEIISKKYNSIFIILNLLYKLSFLHNRCSVLLLIITPCWCAKRQRISLLLNPNLK